MQDLNNRVRDLKAKTYYLGLKNMLKNYRFFNIYTQYQYKIYKLKYFHENDEIIFVNSFQRRCYPILANIIVD